MRQTTKEDAVKRISEFLGYTPNIRYPNGWIGTKTKIEIECPIHGWYTDLDISVWEKGN